MIVFKEIDYKIRDIFNNEVEYYYFEYSDCFAKSSLVFNKKEIEDLNSYIPIVEEDTFDNNHIIHHDFRKINSILYSLKQKGIECQAFKINDGWKVYKKVNDWTPFISKTGLNDFWLSPCRNFYIERVLLRDRRNSIHFNIKAVGIDSKDVGFWSVGDLSSVLGEYYKPELHIQASYVSKDYKKYYEALSKITL